MKDELKKKDEQKLEEMQQEINAVDADEADEAEEAASESAESENEETQEPQDEAAAQIEKLTAELKEKEDRVLRLQADFENFRRRTSKEKEELSAVVTQGMLKDMLPLLDNFERAMAAEAKDGEAFQKGVEMIFTQFTEILKKNGLEFDPNFHQAVMRVQNADMEDDDIAQELQKGYMVKGHVIRPSMVQVVAN